MVSKGNHPQMAFIQVSEIIIYPDIWNTYPHLFYGIKYGLYIYIWININHLLYKRDAHPCRGNYDFTDKNWAVIT